MASQTIITPESDYRAIAQATLPVGASSADISAREASVKQFIASNGGDVIYQNYIKEFGPPQDQREWYIASASDAGASKLGYYYLTHPLTNGSDIILFDCTMAQSFMANDPTIQGLCALSQWDAYVLTKDTAYAQALVDYANAFISQSVDGQVQWKTPMVPAFGITKAPWTSALTQSVVVSTLLRAYQYTSQQKYMDAATASFHWMTIPVSQGGLQSDDIGTWLEEYPTQDPSITNGHVFNGNIWALFGVWDYYRATGDNSAKNLFYSDVQSIKNNIGWFDLGYWNVYSHQNRISPVNGLYMQFIVQQMYAMNNITGDEFFKSLADKWSTDQATDALFVHNMASEYLSQK